MRHRIIAIATFIVAAALAAQSDITFQSLTTGNFGFQTSLRPVLADVVGTSEADLIGVRYDGRVRIIEAGPGFGAVSIQDIGPSSEAGQGMCVDDVDGDGAADIVVAFVTHTKVFLNSGGTWLSISLPYGGNSPIDRRDVHLVDLDGDGDCDIVRDNQVYWGDGLGAFPNSTMIATAPLVLGRRAYGDFDQDGDADLVEVDPGPIPTSVWVRLRRTIGPGVFASPVDVACVRANLVRLHVADFTGDQRPDLALCVTTGVENIPSLRWRIQVFESTVAGDLLPKAAYLGPAPAGRCDLVADADGDGDLDILGGGSFPGIFVPGTFYYWRAHRNRGDGTFEDGGLTYTSSIISSGNAGGVAGDFDGDGDADILYAGSIFGDVTIFFGALVPDATPASTGLSIGIVAGNAQLAAPMNPFAVPFTVVVSDGFGNPVPDVEVSFYEESTGARTYVEDVAPMLATNFAGEATVNLRTTTNLGPSTFTATIAPGVSVSISLTVGFPQTAVKVAGDAQATDFPEAFRDPLVVRVLDFNGQPLAGHPVNFSVSPSNGAVFGGSPNVISDANGFASIGVAPGTFGGAVDVIADVGDHTTSFDLFVRRLAVTVTPSLQRIIVSYMHEHASQAVILGVDSPTVPPTVTPYGTIATSILSPGPFFVGIDPLGSFGIADPALVADPSIVVFYNYPAALLGQSLVFQIYGFDPFYASDLSLAIFVSNSVQVTL